MQAAAPHKSLYIWKCNNIIVCSTLCVKIMLENNNSKKMSVPVYEISGLISIWTLLQYAHFVRGRSSGLDWLAEVSGRNHRTLNVV